MSTTREFSAIPQPNNDELPSAATWLGRSGVVCRFAFGRSGVVRRFELGCSSVVLRFEFGRPAPPAASHSAAPALSVASSSAAPAPPAASLVSPAPPAILRLALPAPPAVPLRSLNCCLSLCDSALSEEDSSSGAGVFLSEISLSRPIFCGYAAKAFMRSAVLLS